MGYRIDARGAVLPFDVDVTIYDDSKLMINHEGCSNTLQKECEAFYREFHLLANLGWVDLDLESSPSWWAGTVASYCPSRMVEHPKSKSTQPRFTSR